MRQINTTTVIVHDNGQLDRVNVVATLRGSLRRLRLFLRGSWKSAAKRLAKPLAEASKCFQAMYAPASSPSLGGHCPPGGPGTAISG
jgi:hypothetical protein